jgi:hypothetical protein
MSGTKGMPHYPLEIKQEAIRLREEARLSYAQITEQLGMRKGGRKEAKNVPPIDPSELLPVRPQNP